MLQMLSLTAQTTDQKDWPGIVRNTLLPRAVDNLLHQSQKQLDNKGRVLLTHDSSESYGYKELTKIIIFLAHNLMGLKQETEGRRAVSAVPEENEAAAEPVSKAPHHEACSSLDIAFEEILQERQSQGRSVSTTSAETQVQTYLSEKNTPKKSDPLQYWKEHAIQFHSMAAVATQYLSAPCSSVDSERLFSAVANVLDENRNRLKPDKKYRIGTRYR
ncbi:uncharacterized protein [Sinocyclocheilus grahami]|uniref:uncharacterized protein n=1 Tax=Sinocyclocheilus grahami TaxID=75366 RepID=UPI0007AD56A6|nr:PREDICTED: uncharacterized protein LOC107568252 [Sinocyclocheilus grahami]